jgi:polyhydroxyalkanoate synthase
LSTSGHIAAIVNPPGNPKAGYRVGDEKLAEVGQWTQTSGTEQSSWWDDYLG